MSHVSPVSLERPGFESVPPTAAVRRPTPTPVLITEHEVAFSTAAGTDHTTRRRWLDTTLLADLGRIFTALTEPRPNYPRREPNYFEAARMSRAMDRL